MSKFSDDIMNEYIFSLFSPSQDVVVGPGMGIDVAITRLKDKVFLISHLDPSKLSHFPVALGGR